MSGGSDGAERADEVAYQETVKVDSSLLQDLQLLGGHDFDLDCFTDDIAIPGIPSCNGYTSDTAHLDGTPTPPPTDERGGLYELIKAADARELLGEAETDRSSSSLYVSSTTMNPLTAKEQETFCVEIAKPLSSPQEFPDRKCAVEGCFKFPQSSTPFCIAHGGGRRCTYPNCTKAARDKLLCAAHGGGKRCSVQGCTKAAVGGSANCSQHGGGKKCTFEGCSKAAQSPTTLCVMHGGGRRCSYKSCTKVARGKTNFCSAHGGGVRCGETGCGRAAIAKSLYCRFHQKSTGSV